MLNARYRKPSDDAFADLADAMEANTSISEITVKEEQFHKTTTTTELLSSPNKYRIFCQCRRNEIQVETLRKNENLSVLPLVLARLLQSDGTPKDDEERSEMEARLLVDRTIAFEMLKNVPVLFAVHGKRKRKE